MRLKTRVLIIIIASLVGLVAMGSFGLYSMRQGMMEERRAQITQLLDFADSQLKYFQGLEVSGKLSREEAQARAKEAIGAQKQGSNIRVLSCVDLFSEAIRRIHENEPLSSLFVKVDHK